MNSKDSSENVGASLRSDDMVGRVNGRSRAVSTAVSIFRKHTLTQSPALGRSRVKLAHRPRGTNQSTSGNEITSQQPCTLDCVSV